MVWTCWRRASRGGGLNARLRMKRPKRPSDSKLSKRSSQVSMNSDSSWPVPSKKRRMARVPSSSLQISSKMVKHRLTTTEMFKSFPIRPSSPRCLSTRSRLRCRRILRTPANSRFDRASSLPPHQLVADYQPYPELNSVLLKPIGLNPYWLSISYSSSHSRPYSIWASDFPIEISYWISSNFICF